MARGWGGDGYRDELAAAHARIANLQEQVRELTGKRGAANTGPPAAGDAASVAKLAKATELQSLLNRQDVEVRAIQTWTVVMQGGAVALLVMAIAVWFVAFGDERALALVPVGGVLGVAQYASAKKREHRRTARMLRRKIDELSAQAGPRIGSDAATALCQVAEADDLVPASIAGARKRPE